mmetsp:Transcript_5703/g.9313  ORF Transcript_5703/g.9313 Transcript_5703/m.9313 type:complete len:213 (-) Transcript_5703:24-662(-)
MMYACTEFCQRQHTSIEQLLQNITVQRCYDPFSLLEVFTKVPSLPLDTQPDVIVLMDWTTLSLPFMTTLDLVWHKRQFGGDAASSLRGKSSCQASLRPLLAEVVLMMQLLARPRGSTPPLGDPESSIHTKMTSTVILTSPLPSTHVTGSSNSTVNQVPFGHLLTDAVDFAVRIKPAPESEVVDGLLKYAADVIKSPTDPGVNTPQPCCRFGL